ncbi:MAG TPA: hypothetical protein VGF69_09745 [Thermoanaerobaculia bacterium]|jgi:hypothetical protein
MSQSEDVLLEVDLTIPDDVDDADRTDNELRLLGKNVGRIYVRRPRCTELLDGEEAYESRRIDMTFGVIPEPDAKITWIRFSVDLSAGLSDQGEVPVVITELHPAERFAPAKVRREYRVEAKLKAEIAEAGGEEKLMVEVDAEEPEIIGYGKDGAQAVWDVRPTTRRPLVGDQQVYVVARKTRGSVLFGHLGIEAELTTRLGRVVPLRKTAEPLQVMFRLC